jgi:transcriptional regulator with XRE-family HTH domain
MKRVITMDMIGKIRRMHRRDKKTKREISRATGLSRNTVAKWLDEAQPVEPKYRREAAKATKLSAHEAELKQALKADAKHGQGLVHADQGSGLRRWLHAGDGLHPQVAPR